MPRVPRGDLDRLLAGEVANPHDYLGAHVATVDGRDGVIVRALIPNAVRVECLLDDGEVYEMEREARGLTDLYSAFIPGATLPLRTGSLHVRRRHDAGSAAIPIAFSRRSATSTCTSSTRARIASSGRSSARTSGRSTAFAGVSFAVWAPNARRVSVVGEFCGWDGRVFPMRLLGISGVWELFIPDIARGALYKFELLTREGAIRAEDRSVRRKDGTAAGQRVDRPVEDAYQWSDDAWIEQRAATPIPSTRRCRSTKSTSARGPACPKTAIGRSRIARSRRGSSST